MKNTGKQPVLEESKVWPAVGPFSRSGNSYRRWRDAKLAVRPTDAAQLVVEVADLGALTPSESAAILDCCRRANMAIYVSPAEPRPDIKTCLATFGATFGLRRLDSNLCADEDGISALQVRSGNGGGEYIPYTDRPLSWHTDGYYNSAEEQVRGVILHCARPAADGGGNALMDPELAYIRLRDENPDYIDALMHPEAMTIPPNAMGGEEIRPARVGPVFSVDGHTGSLHMRYSARKVNIVWRDDAATHAAVDFLNAMLQEDGDDILHWRLEAGQGYIGNNVLHNRTRFSNNQADDSGRLIYRARYFDRIEGTGL